jgi:uncharacterized membrane protein YfcA
MKPETIFLLLSIGLASGILSGLVGVGGGIIIVPALVFFLGFSQQSAQGTSLGLLLLPVGVLAVMNYYKQGFIDWKVITVMCITFIIGGWIGSKLALSISEKTVKRLFAILLFYTAIKMMDWDKTIMELIEKIV